MIVALTVNDHNKLWTGTLIFLVTCEFALLLTYSINATQDSNFSDLASKTPLAIDKAMNVIVLVADLALAGSLVILLHRKRSPFAETNSVIKTITAYTISTSFVTVVISTIALVEV